MFNLSFDNDYEFLKEIYCMSKGLILDDVVETRCLCIKITRELVQLKICRNLIRAIKSRLHRPDNKNIEI